MRYPFGTEGDTVVDFIQGLCRHVKGPNAGELIELQEWQKVLIRDLFELRKDGLRRYRQALIGLPRKNSKSLIGSCVALYCLLDPNEMGAEVYSCAGDKDQARIIHSVAKKMVELEPELSAVIKVYRDALEYPVMGSVYRVLSADSPTKEGLTPSAVLFDEAHVQKNRDLFDVMTLGSGTRKQPLIMATTTAGFDLETICGELYQYGKRVQSGEIKDDSFLMRWWEPSKPDFDYRDPEVWRECNPALGTFLRMDDLEDACRRVPRSVFVRYRLNGWTASEEGWLPDGAWENCRDDTLDLRQDLPLYVGVDVALKHDSTAVICAQRQDDRVVIRGEVFENPHPEGDPRHRDWTLPLEEVHQLLRDLAAAYPAPACEIDGEVKPGCAIAYDPSFFEASAQRLADEGLAMVTWPQSPARMAPAVTQLYAAILEGRLAHDGDPAISRHVANCSPHATDRGYTLQKRRGQRSRKIDAAVAMAMAVAIAQQPAPEPYVSVYEHRGLYVVGDDTSEAT